MKQQTARTRFAVAALAATLFSTAALSAQVFAGGGNARGSRDTSGSAYTQDSYGSGNRNSYGNQDGYADGRQFNGGGSYNNGRGVYSGERGGYNGRMPSQNFSYGDQNIGRRGGWDRDDYRASDRGPNNFDLRRDRHHHQIRERFESDDWGHRHGHPFAVGNHGSHYRY